MYNSILEGRGLKNKGITIYETPEFFHPSAADMASLSLTPHRWILGDKFYKLAHKHYGESEYWWVIAWFNQTPTEAHVDLGDLLYVPAPLDDVLDIYGVQ